MSESTSDAAYIHFDSHNEANTALQKVGYSMLDVDIHFKSEDITLKVGDILKDEGVVVMDMTPTIPCTSHAAYQALTVAAFNAAVSCKSDKNVAFIIMRTNANTPSFLFGAHWASMQALGKDVADKHVVKHTTPAAFIIFQERQISIPSSIFQADELIVARMFAHEITLKSKYFCCELCNSSFVHRSDQGTHIEEVAMGKCTHMFHRSCLLDYIAKTQSRVCPKCQ